MLQYTGWKSTYLFFSFSIFSFSDIFASFWTSCWQIMKKQRSKEANQQLQLANRWKGQGCLGSLRLAQKKKKFWEETRWTSNYKYIFRVNMYLQRWPSFSKAFLSRITESCKKTSIEGTIFAKWKTIFKSLKYCTIIQQWSMQFFYLYIFGKLLTTPLRKQPRKGELGFKGEFLLFP